MPRSAREILPGFPHHVVTRGNNRRRLFSFAGDYRRFLAYLAAAAEDTGCSVHQVALMANHVHLVCTPPAAGDLSTLMKRTCQYYAQYRNRRKQASGKLFEQRYFSDPILNDRQLAAVILYADSNAFRAGRGDSPQDHRWSTCALHAGAPRIEPAIEAVWTPSPWYLGLGRTIAERGEAYREALGSYVASWDRDAAAQWAASRTITSIEALSTGTYTRSLIRPDGSKANDRRSGRAYLDTWETSGKSA